MALNNATYISLVHTLNLGNSLVFQSLGLCTFTAVGLDAIPGQGSRKPCGTAPKKSHTLNLTLPNYNFVTSTFSSNLQYLLPYPYSQLMMWQRELPQATTTSTHPPTCLCVHILYLPFYCWEQIAHASLEEQPSALCTRSNNCPLLPALTMFSLWKNLISIQTYYSFHL